MFAEIGAVVEQLKGLPGMVFWPLRTLSPCQTLYCRFSFAVVVESGVVCG